MADLIIEGTGLDHLYPDGVPIAEVSVTISDIFNKVARITSLVAQTDPFFSRHTTAQKSLIELHGEGSRIANDFILLGAGDILPVFQSMQRWMGYFKDVDENTIEMYEYDSAANPDKIIYRWQIMDTRSADYKMNYTSMVNWDIVTDLNIVRNVQRYLTEAISDYVLREFFKALGHERKAFEYKKSYNENRQNIAFWAKSDLKLQTGRSNG